MSSALRMIRAFSAELMKHAAGIQDAGVQKLLAERKGEEYLEGGKLPSNTETEVQYAIKAAAYGSNSHLGLAADSYDLKANKKKRNTYQKVRDYTVTGMKGGLTGLGVLGAANMMRGRFGSPTGPKQTKDAIRNARKAAVIGASIAVADRAYRHDDLPGKDKKASIVSSTPGPLRTPATQLQQARATGGFKSRVVRQLGKPPKVVQLGKKFRLP